MSSTDDLIPLLKKLRMSGVLQSLELRTRQAADDDLGHGEFLFRILSDEVERRDAKQLESRIRRASFEGMRTLEDFDFHFNPEIVSRCVHARIGLASGRMRRLITIAVVAACGDHRTRAGVATDRAERRPRGCRRREATGRRAGRHARVRDGPARRRAELARGYLCSRTRTCQRSTTRSRRGRRARASGPLVRFVGVRVQPITEPRSSRRATAR